MTMKRKYYHYIYKIIFLKGDIENRYYLGKRTFYGFSIDKDSYHGSGNFPVLYFKKYGAVLGETYIKEILEENDSIESNRDRENIIIGDLWKTDPLCMNQCPGGAGSSNHISIVEAQNKTKKKINQYDLYGNFIQTWDGIRECARELNINRTGITACLGGRKPSAFGYQWRYYTGDENPIEPFYKIEPIVQYTRNGDIVNEFECPIDAEHLLGISSSSIRQVCKGERIAAGDFIWRFKNDAFDKYRTKLIDPKDKNRIYEKQIRPILRYSKDGIYIDEFENVSKALEAINGKTSSMIYEVARGNGRHKTAYGYIWKFKDQLED